MGKLADRAATLSFESLSALWKDIAMETPEAQAPVVLPEWLEWETVDFDNDEVGKDVYELLAQHYAEGSKDLLRVDYTLNFLKWALKPPGHKPEWHVGIRVKTPQDDFQPRQFVGFISAIPRNITVRDYTAVMAEVNFLCVNRDLRSSHLTPALIGEITRRVHLHGVWQGVFAVGVDIPGQVASAMFHHRPLNLEKLGEDGLPSLTSERIDNPALHYALPETTMMPGLRPMEEKDVTQVTALLNGYLQSGKFDLYPRFDEVEIKHWLCPPGDLGVTEGINAFVIEDGGTVTDLCSFTFLPATIMPHTEENGVKIATSYWNVATTVPLTDLIQDLLILAKQRGVDIFNALEAMENKTFLEERKFRPGVSYLHYFVNNFQCALIPADRLALILH